MANIVSYLKWRGDLPLTEYPFQVVDNLVLTYLSYFDFKGIVADIFGEEKISIKDACCLYLDKIKDKEQDENYEFIKALMESERFANALLWGYEEIFDCNILKTQFAALCIELEDGTVYISFRGTDNSIVGWREDFCSSFEITFAQRHAKEYLEKIIDTERNIKYRIGGHSKGGNLSIYAAMMSEDAVKEHICEIYSNDGPGLCQDLIDKDRYKEIESRIIKTVPEFCVIGRLFDNTRPQHIVKCRCEGLTQHDVLNWKVEGNAFVEARHFAKGCRHYHEIFERWFEAVDKEQRRAFTNELFDALEAGGAVTIEELAKGGADGFESILFSMVRADKGAKLAIWKLIKIFFIGLKNIDYIELLKEQKVLRGIALFLVGTLFAALPQVALNILGTAFFIWLLGYSLLRLHSFGKRYRKGEKVDKTKAVFYGTIAVVEIVLIVQQKIIQLSANVVLAIFLMIRAYQRAKLTVENKLSGDRKYIYLFADAVLTAIFAMVALAFSANNEEPYLFITGNYLAIIGMSGVLKALYENARKNKRKF